MKGRRGLGLLVMAFAMAMTLAFGVKIQANAATSYVGPAKNTEFYNTKSTGNGEMAQVVEYRITKRATGTKEDEAGVVEVIGCKSSAKKICIQGNITYVDADGTKYYYRTKSIANGAFKDNKKLTYVQINKSDITAIPDSCFSGCTKLKTVNIQNTIIKKIGKKAFYNCKKLSSFAIASNKISKKSYVQAKAFTNVKNVKVYGPSTSKAKKYATWFAAKGALNTSYADIDDFE